MIEHTTDFNMTLEHATAMANAWTKGISYVDGSDKTVKPYYWQKEYNTAIRSQSAVKDEECCWAITNKFDPRVARGE